MPVTNYIWDVETDSYLMETDGSNVTQAVYTNEPVPFGNLVSQRRASTTNYCHFDALGSTRQLTDATQVVTDTFTYDAWGTLLSHQEAILTVFSWGGELQYYSDFELDNVIFRSRTYCPSIARWASPSSPYAHSKNNPTSTDLSETCFQAGKDLERPGCENQGLGGSHEVCYNTSDVMYCKVLLTLAAGGGPLRGYPCAGLLLKNFLTGALDPYCPQECKDQLRQSSLWNMFFQDAIVDIVRRLKCNVISKFNRTYRYGGPCKDPFTSGGSADEDLKRGIGAVDDASFTINARLACGKQAAESASKKCCCCKGQYRMELCVEDTYDFISTLPQREKRRGLFWCAAVLEHAKEGTPFTTLCCTSDTGTIDGRMCVEV